MVFDDNEEVVYGEKLPDNYMNMSQEDRINCFEEKLAAFDSKQFNKEKAAKGVDR